MSVGLISPINPASLQLRIAPSGLWTTPQTTDVFLQQFPDLLQQAPQLFSKHPQVLQRRLIFNLQTCPDELQLTPALQAQLQLAAETHQMILSLRWIEQGQAKAKEFEPQAVQDIQRGLVYLAMGDQATQEIEPITSTGVIFRLINELKGRQNSRWAQHQLTHLGEQVEEPLWQALEHINQWDRDKAFSILGEIGETRTKERLLTRLASEETSDQSAVIRALGNLSVCKATPLLKSKLTAKTHPELYKAAVTALTQINPPEIYELLHDAWEQEFAIKDDQQRRDDVLICLLKTLNKVSPQRAHTTLTAVCDGENDEIREPALFMLCHHNPMANLPRLIHSLQTTQSSSTRSNLLRLVNEIYSQLTLDVEKERELATAIEGYLQDKEQWVVKSAIKTLALIGSQQCYAAVLKTTQSRHPEILIAAIEALGCWGEQALPRLREFTTSRNPKILGAVCSAWGNSRQLSVLPQLISASSHTNHEIRGATANALRNFYEIVEDKQEIIGLWVQQLSDPHYLVHGRAESALKAFAGEAIVPLSSALNIPRPNKAQKEFIMRAITVLGDSHEPTAIQPIVNSLSKFSHSDYPERKIVDALSEIGPSAIPTLIELLATSSSKMKREVAKALGKSKDPSVIPHLFTSMEANDQWSGHAVQEALTNYGDQAFEGFAERLNHENAAIRKHAINGLSELGYIKALPLLLGRLQHETDEEVLTCLARALAELADLESLEQLLAIQLTPKLTKTLYTSMNDNIMASTWMADTYRTHPAAILQAGHLILGYPEDEIYQLQETPLVQAIFNIDPAEELFPTLHENLSDKEYKQLITQLTRLYEKDDGKSQFFRSAYNIGNDFLNHPIVIAEQNEFFTYLDEYQLDLDEVDPNQLFASSLVHQRLSTLGNLTQHQQMQSDRQFMMETLVGRRRADLAKQHQKRARRLKTQYAEYLKNRVPSVLRDVAGVLPSEVIPLGDNYAYVPVAQLVFRPSHYCINRSKTIAYAHELSQGAAFPPVEVVAVKGEANIWVWEGHHRSAAAYLSGADFVKVQFIERDVTEPDYRSSPFKNEGSIPMRFILLNDEAWEHEVA